MTKPTHKPPPAQKFSKPRTPITQSGVDALLDQAVENGYQDEITRQDPRSVAWDMQRYSPECENEPTARLVLFIEDWQKRHVPASETPIADALRYLSALALEKDQGLKTSQAIHVLEVALEGELGAEERAAHPMLDVSVAKELRKHVKEF